MRFQSRRPRSDDERILPLINVVFLLLIFFMLAGQFSAVDPFGIVPPKSQGQGSVAVEELVVQIAAEGRLALDGVILEDADLKVAVADRLAGREDMKIRLKADGEASALRVVAVMELLREAGVDKLQLLTIAVGN